MTVTLDLTPEIEQELREEALRQGVTVEGLTQQALIEKLLTGLRAPPMPQSLAELNPRVQPPPGKTIKEMLPTEPWPGEETDEELLAALKALS